MVGCHTHIRVHCTNMYVYVFCAFDSQFLWKPPSIRMPMHGVYYTTGRRTTQLQNVELTTCLIYMEWDPKTGQRMHSNSLLQAIAILSHHEMLSTYTTDESPYFFMVYREPSNGLPQQVIQKWIFQAFGVGPRFDTTYMCTWSHC